jgi:hypothetical protein
MRKLDERPSRIVGGRIRVSAFEDRGEEGS